MDVWDSNLGEHIKENSGNRPTGSQSVKTGHVNTRPWPRLFARVLDLNIYFLLFLALIPDDLFTKYFQSNEFFILFNLILLLLMTQIETNLLTWFGTTIGKALFGIRLTDKDGNPLTYRKTFFRSLCACCLGFGIGYPGILNFTYIYWYFQLRNTGTTIWDKNKFTLHHKRLGALRYFAIGIIFFIVSFSSYQLLTLKLNEQSAKSALTASVNGMNETLPSGNDSIALLGVKLANKSVILHFRYRDEATTDLQDQQYIAKGITQNFCQQPNLVRYQAQGYRFQYKYFDKNDRLLWEFIINPKDCRQLANLYR